VLHKEKKRMNMFTRIMHTHTHTHTHTRARALYLSLIFNITYGNWDGVELHPDHFKQQITIYVSHDVR